MPDNGGANAPKTAETQDSPSVGDVVDDQLNAAEQTRTTARWVASALGAIPALGIVSSFIRAPGDLGFDEFKLTAGLLLVGLGALAAMAAFANVIRPVGVSNKDLEAFDIRRVPGGRQTTGKDLVDRIEEVRAGAAALEGTQRGLKAASAVAEARAARCEATAVGLEAASKLAPGNGPLAAKAATARAEADAAHALAAAANADLAGAQVGVDEQLEQLHRLNLIRADAMRIKSADVVGTRFKVAMLVLPLAGLLVVFGAVQLAMAPKLKAQANGAPTLVTLTLNRAGQDLLGCSQSTIQAIRVGGDDAAPVVITIPTASCPVSKSVTFKNDPQVGLGSSKAVDVLEAPAFTPAPSSTTTPAP